MVSTVDVNAVGLGVDILYQSYFVCLKETWQSTVIEYGKSQATTEKGDVYLTMIDRDDPLFVRFYSFGNGEKPLDIVDAHIISRHLTKANCRGDTVLDKLTNMCVQHCHELCDPTQGNFTFLLFVSCLPFLLNLTQFSTPNSKESTYEFEATMTSRWVLLVLFRKEKQYIFILQRYLYLKASQIILAEHGCSTN